MEEKGQKRPERKPAARPGKEKPSDARRLRKGIYRLDFKKGVEPLPAEISGPIVGMFPRTAYSYEIIWLEEDPPTEG